MRSKLRCWGFLLGLFLSFCISFWANAAFASYYCRQTPVDELVSGPDSAENIMVGVVVSTRQESRPGTDQFDIVGELKVRETLRGKPRDSLRVEVVDSGHVNRGRGVIHIGRQYLVLLSDQSPGVFKIGVCTKPLTLNANDVTFMDGCRLYRIRELLHIDQTRSRACEVLNRPLARGVNLSNSEELQEEYRRAKWKDLGIDWGG